MLGRGHGACEANGFGAREGLRLIVLEISRNVWIPRRRILKGIEYLVACVLVSGLEMNVKILRAYCGVRGFGYLARIGRRVLREIPSLP